MATSWLTVARFITIIFKFAWAGPYLKLLPVPNDSAVVAKEAIKRAEARAKAGPSGHKDIFEYLVSALHRPRLGGRVSTTSIFSKRPTKSPKNPEHGPISLRMPS